MSGWVDHRGQGTPAVVAEARGELACARAEIDHRLTKPFHPWTNGRVEWMNRTIKDATVRS